MTLFAAADLQSIPFPESLSHKREIARYQAWLEEAYRTAISGSVRILIAEVSTELAEISATGCDLSGEFGDAVRGAVSSVATAIDHEDPTRLTP